MNEIEILKYATENGMIDLSYVQEKVEMNKRKGYLEKHKYEIWQGADGKWYTYLPDEKKGRVLKKRTTEKDIQDAIVEYYREIEEHPCFREAYERWIAEKAEFEEIGKNSITRYDNDFQRFFRPDEPFCRIRLCDVTDSDLEHFIKRSIKEKRLTAKSYAMLRLILNGVFKFAKREKYTNYSISTFFSDLSLPKNIFKRKARDNAAEVFSEKEVKELMKYFEENPTLIHMGLTLCFLSGLRVGELSSLKHGDNVKRCVLRVCRTEIIYKDKEIGRRVTVVKDFPKTDSGLRNVIIPMQAQEVLQRIMRENPSGEYLFMNGGKRVTERMFNYYLQRACKEIGIPPRSTHKIRKTYGSKLLSNGADESIVLEQMGHKNISTTHGYYHYDILDDGERFKRIDAIVNFEN